MNCYELIKWCATRPLCRDSGSTPIADAATYAACAPIHSVSRILDRTLRGDAK